MAIIGPDRKPDSALGEEAKPSYTSGNEGGETFLINCHGTKFQGFDSIFVCLALSVALSVLYVHFYIVESF